MTRALVTLYALGVAMVTAGCPGDRCCQADGDCVSGAVCFEGRCAPRCTDDAQCLEGQSCNGVLCVDPLRSSSVCDFEDAEKPWTNPAVIDGDAGTDAGPDRPACSDSREPNDSADEAFLVPVPAELTPESELCPGDEDWYIVNVNAGQELSASLTFDAETADLDLEILSHLSFSELDVVAASRGITGLEEAAFRPDYSGAYYVRVFAFDDAAADYALDITLSFDQPMCADDPFEEDDWWRFASPLGEDVTDAAICPFDIDFFSFDVPAGASTVVSLAEPSPQLAPQMWGYSPEWGAVWGGLSYATSLPGEHFVVVSPIEVTASSDGMPYELIRTETAANPCPLDLDDGYEPNDTRDTATEISGLPADVSGFACDGSPDFFRVAWPATERGFDVVANGDIQVSIFEGDRLLRARGQGLPWIDFAEPSGNTDEFYVLVTAPPGWGGPYALVVE